VRNRPPGSSSSAAPAAPKDNAMHANWQPRITRPKVRRPNDVNAKRRPTHSPHPRTRQNRAHPPGAHSRTAAPRCGVGTASAPGPFRPASGATSPANFQQIGSPAKAARGRSSFRSSTRQVPDASRCGAIQVQATTQPVREAARHHGDSAVAMRRTGHPKRAPRLPLRQREHLQERTAPVPPSARLARHRKLRTAASHRPAATSSCARGSTTRAVDWLHASEPRRGASNMHNGLGARVGLHSHGRPDERHRSPANRRHENADRSMSRPDLVHGAVVIRSAAPTPFHVKHRPAVPGGSTDQTGRTTT